MNEPVPVRMPEPTLFRLFLAFGGGFASVPLLFYEIVEVRAWLDGPTFLDGIALGQFTPGPIVITATFVGYLLHSLVGACVATSAMFLPSLLLVIGIAPYFPRLRASLWFSPAISGMFCSFVGPLATVTVRITLQAHYWDWLHLLLALAALRALVQKSISSGSFLAERLSIFFFGSIPAAVHPKSDGCMG